MDTTSHHVVFDLFAKGYDGGPDFVARLKFALVAILVGLLVTLWSRMTRRRIPWVLVLGLTGVGTARVVAQLAITYSQYELLREAVRKGEYTTVEGRVTDFQAGDTHIPESFRVSGHQYTYYSSRLSVAFNRDSARDGPIRNGRRVRLTDVNGSIVRLELFP